VYPAASTITFTDLVDNPNPYNILQDSSTPVRCTLIFDPNGHPKFGGFKRAVLGHTSLPAIGSTRVCIKQCFYRNSGSTEKHLYDNTLQIKKLSGEINCIRWATAIMRLVYDFVDSELEARGPPPFDIPRMRFINVALAVAQNEQRDVYMLEEEIGPRDGAFHKYMTNNSAIPLPTLDPERRSRAEFLAFAQHVQYHTTKQMVFVSDFQGKF
jgi:hypothetical protein